MNADPSLNEVRATGVSGTLALEQIRRQALQNLTRASELLGDRVCIDPELTSVRLAVDSTELWANLPVTPCSWLMSLRGKFDSAKWQIEAYLTHLAWQYSLSLSAPNQSYPTYALFSCGTVKELAPLEGAESCAHLSDWIALYALMQRRPLSLPLTHSTKAADAWQHEPPSTKGIDKQWQQASDFSFAESTSDPNWALITRGRSANRALIEDLTPHIELYAQIRSAFLEVADHREVPA